MSYVLLLGACAHRVPKQDDAFREIQVHEAAMARAQARLAQAPCDEAHVHTASVCSSQSALCALSSELHDADATTRCLRAGDACTGAREHTLARCATEPPP